MEKAQILAKGGDGPDGPAPCGDVHDRGEAKNLGGSIFHKKMFL